MNQADYNTQCRKTLLKILKETASHYTSKNRAVGKHGDNLYKNKDDKRCSIGRIMKKKCLDRLQRKGHLGNLIKTLIDNGHIDAGDFYSNYNITDEMLKNKNFVAKLSLIQFLHDKDTYWDKKGLTKSGEIYAHKIEGEIFKKF